MSKLFWHGYLARYISGGPISNSRIVRDEDGRVTFWARSEDKTQRNRSRPFTSSGKEFVRRWSMHILPKAYTPSRCFGGCHGAKRKAYLHRCRELLATDDSAPTELAEPVTEHNAEVEYEYRDAEYEYETEDEPEPSRAAEPGLRPSPDAQSTFPAG